MKQPNMVILEGNGMHREDLIGDSLFTLKDFFTPKDCAQSITFSESRGFQDAPITTDEGFVMRKDLRDNSRVMVDSRDLAHRLFLRARPFLPFSLGAWCLEGMNERFRYYRYDVGQTFRQHLDGPFVRTDQEESKLTFMVYLNDDFTGGSTTFYEVDGTIKKSVQPKTGMALVFGHAQLHEGTAVLSGRKYVLRTDVMYRKLRLTVVQLEGSLDRAPIVLAGAFQNAGFRVSRWRMSLTVEAMIEAALADRADALCVCSLYGKHMTVFPQMLKLMAEKGMQNMLLIGGGTFPPEDAQELLRLGGARLYGPTSDTRDVVRDVQEEILRRLVAATCEGTNDKGPTFSGQPQ